MPFVAIYTVAIPIYRVWGCYVCFALLCVTYFLITLPEAKNNFYGGVSGSEQQWMCRRRAPGTHTAILSHPCTQRFGEHCKLPRLFPTTICLALDQKLVESAAHPQRYRARHSAPPRHLQGPSAPRNSAILAPGVGNITARALPHIPLPPNGSIAAHRPPQTVNPAAAYRGLVTAAILPPPASSICRATLTLGPCNANTPPHPATHLLAGQ